MRDCAVCGAAVDGDVCPSCGAGAKQGRKREAIRDPMRFRCADVDKDGNRCAAFGTRTESLRFEDAGDVKWFCQQHFPLFSRVGARPSAPFEYPTVALEAAEKKRDGKDWARLILKRHEAGERLPMISLESAREVLEVKE